MASVDLTERAAAALQRAIAIGVDTYEARGDLAEAFAAVEWPDPPPTIMPLAEDLTPAQRALVTALAACPAVALAFLKLANVRLSRWHGIAPPVILERIVPDRGAPLWRVMRELEEARDPDEMERFLSTMSIDERLEAFGEVNACGYEKPYRLDGESFFSYRNVDLLRALRDEGKILAPQFADRLLTHDRKPTSEVTWPVFLALVRAGIPIEPRWDTLLPLGDGLYRDLTDEVIAAIAPERRDAAIVGALTKVNQWSVGLPLLERYPSTALATLLLEKASALPPALLKEAKRVAKMHPVVASVLETTLANAPKPLALSIARVLVPTSIDELTLVEQEQLAIVGKWWDRKEATAAERLATDGRKTSLVGRVELRSLVGADGAPAYDAWLNTVGSAAVYVAGTLQIVAYMIQHTIECSDRALRQGLPLVLRRAKKSATSGAMKAAKKPVAKRPAIPEARREEVRTEEAHAAVMRAVWRLIESPSKRPTASRASSADARRHRRATSSEIVADLAPGATVIEAFDTVPMSLIADFTRAKRKTTRPRNR